MNDATNPAARAATAAEPLPLFREFPVLAARLPHVPLGLFPTPVEKADQLGSALGLDRFYMKRDDLSGAVYGGNKVRMLEFLLGSALRANAREVVTVGYVHLRIVRDGRWLVYRLQAAQKRYEVKTI
jgi:hypothetical protein